MKTYEYRVVERGLWVLEEFLNAFGADGWLLVQKDEVQHDWSTQVTLIFVRETSKGNEEDE